MRHAAYQAAVLGLENKVFLPVLSLHPRPSSKLTVVALCCETVEVINHFVSRQLALGAGRMVLYFDDPADPVPQMLQGHDRVICRSCDDAFWFDLCPDTGRPIHLEMRQKNCFNHAYAGIEAGNWVGFCDADELFVPDTSFDALFEEASPDIAQLTAATWEAVWTDLEQIDQSFSASHARRKLHNERVRQQVLHHHSPLFRILSDSGLVGHWAGKKLVRSGIPQFRAGIHHHRHRVDGELLTLSASNSGLKLLHYDAVSFAAWQRKHGRRMDGSVIMGARMDKRYAQAELMSYARTEQARRDLFLLLYGIGGSYLQALKETNAILPISGLDGTASPARTGDL
ncbi:MAG: glycosyltransferase family 2 protein [Paracoccus sp. (in: a-proteobacteria)]|uniref:glycosyltransferase family 2 protein n=1 Tax=Paracoccus sp. TaxID=267 RepID=UPI0026E0E2C9|nr:glycosyltransferase family 2 protein [Paracoccus sp. (in: a-proteobacteria)]MDO5621379.1 glycosyltransferase family 2 protein [Paracoccus sp. (in: a-proteobacteria)]